MEEETRLRGAGGTSGGLGEFFAGCVMVAAGGYLLTSRVTVSTGYWSFRGYDMFGLALVPFAVGIGILFFNGRSLLGRLVLVCGAGIILAGILANLRIYFEPTSLFSTLMMLGLLAAGLGLIVRALRPH